MNLFLDSFNRLADRQGVLAVRQLGPLLRSVGENPTKEELQDMVNWLDRDATGIVKFPDFLLMMASKVLFAALKLMCTCKCVEFQYWLTLCPPCAICFVLQHYVLSI